MFRGRGFHRTVCFGSSSLDGTSDETHKISVCPLKCVFPFDNWKIFSKKKTVSCHQNFLKGHYLRQGGNCTSLLLYDLCSVNIYCSSRMPVCIYIACILSLELYFTQCFAYCNGRKVYKCIISLVWPETTKFFCTQNAQAFLNNFVLSGLKMFGALRNLSFFHGAQKARNLSQVWFSSSLKNQKVIVYMLH